MKTFSRILAISLILLFALIGHAQNGDKDYDHYYDKETIPIKEYEIGLNVSQLINQFFSFNSNPIFFQQYLFTYKSTRGKNIYFRSGFGFNFQGSRDKDGVGEPDADNYLVGVRARFGVEKYIPIKKKWLLTYGVDLPIEYSYSNSRSLSQFQDVRLKSTRLSGGVGPVLGIHYRINDRIKIGTESTFYLNLYTRKNITEIDGAEVDSNGQDGVTANLNSPISLYFSMTI